jgi:hypothetical protein
MVSNLSRLSLPNFSCGVAATEELLAVREKKTSKPAMDDELFWSELMEYVWKA